MDGTPIDNRFERIAESLLNAPGIQVNARNNATATPLHMLAGFVHESRSPSTKIGAVRHPDINETYRPDLSRVAELLIRNGADPNLRDINGNMPLHWAALHGISDLVGTLISNGALVDASNFESQTPLMKAAQKGYLNIMQQLIATGADVNRQDRTKGRTPLLWVQRMREGAMTKHGDQMSKERALQAIYILLNAGANPTIKDKGTAEDHIPRSSLEWAQEKTPWPVHDNKELQLLLTSPFARSLPVAQPIIQPAGPVAATSSAWDFSLLGEELPSIPAPVPTPAATAAPLFYSGAVLSPTPVPTPAPIAGSSSAHPSYWSSFYTPAPAPAQKPSPTPIVSPSPAASSYGSFQTSQPRTIAARREAFAASGPRRKLNVNIDQYLRIVRAGNETQRMNLLNTLLDDERMLDELIKARDDVSDPLHSMAEEITGAYRGLLS